MLARVSAAVAASLLLAFAGAAHAEGEREAQSRLPGSMREMLELPADNVRDALDSELRPAADRSRDATERIEAVLRASGVARGMRAVDLRAGDGDFAQVLALAVRRFGKVWAGNDPDTLDPAASQAWQKRLNGPSGGDIGEIRTPLGEPLPPWLGRIDVVFARGVMDEATRRGISRAAVHEAALRVLSPGGRYVIVGARATEGADAAAAATLCRVSESAVRTEVEAAGFRLVAASDALAVAGDPHTASACGLATTDRYLMVYEKPRPAADANPPADPPPTPPGTKKE